MEIKVRIIQVTAKRSGTSRAGKEYTTQEFIGETFEDQYPRKVCFLVLNDKVSIPQVGSDVTVSFDLESRSFTDKNGIERWSTDVKPYRIDSATQFAATPAPQQQSSPAPQQPAMTPQQMDAAAAAFFGQSQQPHPSYPSNPSNQSNPSYQPQPDNDLPF